MSAEQKFAWFQKQMNAAMDRGEDPGDALERIATEQRTKTFAHVEDRPAFSGLDRLKAIQTLRKIQPSWKEEPAVKPVQATDNPHTRPAPPKTPIVLVPIEPARYQYVVRELPICDEDGLPATIRVVVE